MMYKRAMVDYLNMVIEDAMKIGKEGKLTNQDALLISVKGLLQCANILEEIVIVDNNGVPEVKFKEQNNG